VTFNVDTCNEELMELNIINFSRYFNEGIGDHNYCRNPTEDEDSVWCYKATGGWEWCDVPTCSG
jgi:hypothetical protein